MDQQEEREHVESSSWLSASLLANGIFKSAELKLLFGVFGASNSTSHPLCNRLFGASLWCDDAVAEVDDGSWKFEDSTSITAANEMTLTLSKCLP